MTQRRLDRANISIKNNTDTDANFDDLFDVWANTQSTLTLTSQTAAQQLLNSSTNGQVELDVGLYEFECMFSLSSMSASSGGFGFALGGNATIGAQNWASSAIKVATLATGGSANTSQNTAANTNISGSNTNTAGAAYICGTFTVTTRGTIQPQVSLGVAAAAVIAAGAFFRVKKLSANSGQAALAPPQPGSPNLPVWG